MWLFINLQLKKKSVLFRQNSFFYSKHFKLFYLVVFSLLLLFPYYINARQILITAPEPDK
ncbi:secreted protein, partial [Candidatus Magnetomorum sp. HK-1]